MIFIFGATFRENHVKYSVTNSLDKHETCSSHFISIPIICSYVNGVGAAANTTRENIQKNEPRYEQYYRNMLKKSNKTFVQEDFEKYVTSMYMAHITRNTETGCGSTDRYVASPSRLSHKIAIVDGKKNILVGMMDGGKNTRTILWVANNNKMPSREVMLMPTVILIVPSFLALMLHNGLGY